ncbi:(2Fe-2S) ferredoxin domain-containing protein [Magnetococcales bacterium HHB-1]
MEPTLLVCINQRAMADSCFRRGGAELIPILEERLAAENMAVTIEAVHCLGHCAKGPNIRCAPGGPFFEQVDRGRIGDIVLAVKQWMEKTGKN